MVGRICQVYGATTGTQTDVQERTMIQHPTVVHWAADHQRQELLAEVVSDRRTTPRKRRKTASGNAVRTLFTSIAAVVSRIVDDFEPGGGPRSARVEGEV